MPDNLSRHRAQYEAYNRRDIDGVLSDIADDAVLIDHALGQTFSGADEIREWTRLQLDAFSDDRADVVDAFGAGDWTVIRFTSRGTHDGPWGGVEATHRVIESSACDLTRWEQGKGVETHVFYDLYGPLAQMGQVPALTAPA